MSVIGMRSDIAALDEVFGDTADVVVDSAASVLFRGNPSDVEVAAIVAVLTAAASAPPSVPHPPVASLGEWGAPADRLHYGLGYAPTVFVNARYSR
ncbi:acyl-CoA carboxylase subunit epsilon [Rhodococcus sovatensis]|uniref:Acyl-CoA carboxylase subunit epsilon n=1 Tax=Rhodococcus sovatensis TaxID=1805840 RepID=A0ABZ2PNW9_9NOCA